MHHRREVSVACVLVSGVLVVFGCAHPDDVGSQSEPDDGGSTSTGGSAGQSGKGGKAGRGGTSGSGAGGSGGTASGGSAGAGGAGTGGAGGGSGGAAAGAGQGGGGTQGGIGGTASGGTAGISGNGGTAGATGLSVKYKVEVAGPSGTAMGSELLIFNDGTETVPLNELTLRYYFTNEVTAALGKNINWANLAPKVGGAATQIPGQISIDVATVAPPTSTANSYIGIQFSASSLALSPGHRVQLSWTVQNSASQNFTQTNDYSFNSSMTSSMDWPNVVLMRGSVRIWGQEPQ